MMNKQTILAVLISVLLLIGGQWIINKAYPPKPLPPKSVTLTNAVGAAVAPAATNAVPELKPATPAPEPEPTGPKPAEQLVTLSNKFVRVEFTSWGGGVKTVELLQQKANGHGDVMLNEGATVPALALKGVAGAETAYSVEQTSSTSVVMRARSHGVTVTKTFLLNQDYLLTGNVQVTGAATQKVDMVVGTIMPQYEKDADTFFGVDFDTGGKYQKRTDLWDSQGVLIFKKRLPTPKHHEESVNAQWVGVKNQFFTMLLTPDGTNVVSGLSYDRDEGVPASWWKLPAKPTRLVASATLTPTTTAAETSTYQFTWYAGPKEYSRLKALGKSQEGVMDFGMFGIISVLLLHSMTFLHGIIPNYGVAIILITIAIKIIFWPLSAKQMKSMREMQKFQPLINKLKEKYKDDPQRQQQEMMKLYKEHKINPLGGCLPMLVQIPVFFGLFSMLRSAIELRGAGFLWIHDLSQADTIFHIAGLPVNPLPIVMTGAMLWQQKITPQTGDTQQAKMMMFMPLMMLFFFYSASSGLALYWTIQQFLSIAQQWYSMRQPTTGTVTVIPPAGRKK